MSHKPIDNIKTASKSIKRLEAVRLHFIEGYNYNETAKALATKQQTVSKWVRQYKAKMKFDEDLRDLKQLIENENAIPFLNRLEMNKRIKTIEQRTLVINFTFFEK